MAKHYSEHAPLLAEGITVHFFNLIETFPNADYSEMLAEAKATLEKTNVPELRSALEKLVTRLESVKKPA
jgi:hypothetical protein